MYRTIPIMATLPSKPNIQHLTQHLLKTASNSAGEKEQRDLVSSLSLAINELRENLLRKTASAKTVSTYFDELTWIDTEDQELRQTIIGLLESSRVWYNSELEYSNIIQPLIKNGIAGNEFKEYKEAIEDLGEAIEDLTSAIVTLPVSKDFNEAMKELSNL